MEAGRPVRHLNLAMPQHRHARDFTLGPPPLPRAIFRPPPPLEPLMPPRRRGAVDLSPEDDPLLRELIPNRALRRSPRLNNLSDELGSTYDELEILGDLELTAARINNTSTRRVTEPRLRRIRAVAERLIPFSIGDREDPSRARRSGRSNLLPLGLHESLRETPTPPVRQTRFEENSGRLIEQQLVAARRHADQNRNFELAHMGQEEGLGLRRARMRLQRELEALRQFREHRQEFEHWNAQHEIRRTNQATSRAALASGRVTAIDLMQDDVDEEAAVLDTWRAYI
jgi:hypothetical protein